MNFFSVPQTQERGMTMDVYVSSQPVDPNDDKKGNITTVVYFTGLCKKKETEREKERDRERKRKRGREGEREIERERGRERERER